MTTAVSAPGKVLLAGGYLVLDRAHTGLVFGLSARLHVIIHDIDTSSGVKLSEIVVNSPQFRGAQWRYGYHQAMDDGGCNKDSSTHKQMIDAYHGITSDATEHLSRNPFIETALSYALTYITSITSSTIKPTSITILADNDYYSNPGTALPDASSQRFHDFDVQLRDAHKTGLGSSAALVTAFTGAVLSHYLSKSQFSLSTRDGHAQLHNLAQASHCAAQGKVGSGFDVAAAVYGTCIYRRFSPSLLSELGEPGSSNFSLRLRQSVDDLNPDRKWDTQVVKEGLAIPKGMALVMCDVDCGSQTVGMVKKVLEWRKQKPEEAKDLWDQLQLENETFAEKLHDGSSADLNRAIERIRGRIREMGARSGVPIEPQEQTALLDAVTNKVEGVCGGVVPGAGGYDAIVLLVRDDETTLEQVKTFVSEWSASTSSNVKLLDVKGEMEGVRREDSKAYGTWIK
ncbi:MAG: phosphomevalonate kinase [Claussenomyces sp. TS43310]|nr:MAG: phosphomevalonate kinase [Claussenomyces sp. TS43310]